MISFERYFVRLSDRLPAMNLAWREWLARNVWVIVLIIAMISAVLFIGSFALLINVRHALEGLLFMARAPFGSVFLGELIINSALTVASIVLSLMAVSPLRHRSYIGWKRLYGAILLQIGANVILPIVTVVPAAIVIKGSHLIDILALVVNGVLGVVSLYVLFQVRPSFKPRT